MGVLVLFKGDLNGWQIESRGGSITCQLPDQAIFRAKYIRIIFLKYALCSIVRSINKCISLAALPLVLLYSYNPAMYQNQSSWVSFG